MKTAFIVIGPESSGTRIVTRLFCLAGCQGGDAHVQALDGFVDYDELFPYKDGDIVFRRSVPHANKMPGIARIQHKFVSAGFRVHWIIVVRDWGCNVESAPQHGHKATVAEERERLQREWAYIGDGLKHMNKFYFILSSQMFLDPERALVGLERQTRLSFVENANIIRDADAKYFG